jgi:malonyl CoA-acyl carrier protein transacylase
MIELTPDQIEAIQKATASAQRLKAQADKARDLGLPVLETFLRDASVSCQAGADFQLRAFRDAALQHEDKTVIDRAKQADAIADAIKRRGL